MSRELSRFTENDRTAIVKGDGGSYSVDLFISEQKVSTVEFKEHTLRIVENYAKKWIQETDDSIS
jgi:hypothetical protein